MKQEQLTNLLYEARETEQGGIKIYETAVSAAVNGRRAGRSSGASARPWSRRWRWR